jgi:hypothetical protein
MSTPNFREALNGPNDDLNRFDSAGSGDLSAFDEATGETVIPAGLYLCDVVRGELVTTKTTGKTAYRLSLDVSDGPHRGFRLWRYYTFDTPSTANRAKFALAPLGLTTSAELRKPFPGPGRTVKVRALVAVQVRPDGTRSNDVERFTVESDTTAMPNPNAVNLDGFTPGEGGTP